MRSLSKISLVNVLGNPKAQNEKEPKHQFVRVVSLSMIRERSVKRSAIEVVNVIQLVELRCSKLSQSCPVNVVPDNKTANTHAQAIAPP
jgi:hypothetical protein